MIAGAGNRATDELEGVPASFKVPSNPNYSPDIFVVGAVGITISEDKDKEDWGQAWLGQGGQGKSKYIDVYAPGTDLVCTEPDGTYTLGSSTDEYNFSRRGTSECKRDGE
jgi:hypothetical protein